MLTLLNYDAKGSLLEVSTVGMANVREEDEVGVQAWNVSKVAEYEDFEPDLPEKWTRVFVGGVVYVTTVLHGIYERRGDDELSRLSVLTSGKCDETERLLDVSVRDLRGRKSLLWQHRINLAFRPS